MNPKYLLQRYPTKGFGVIRAYNPHIATRPDVVPYDGEMTPDGRVSLAIPDAPVQGNKKASYQNNLEGNGVVPVKKTDEVPPVVAPFQNNATPGTPKDGDIAGDEESPESLVPIMTHEGKIAKLIEVIGKLPNNTENYTGQGLPRIEVLMLALDGVDVSAADRQEAMDTIKKNALEAA